MKKILVRVGKRRSAWESRDASQIIDYNFQHMGRPDLEPSVYEVDVEDDAAMRAATIRVHAEHQASLLDRPMAQVDVDAGRLPFLVNVVEGDTAFSFTRAAHRQLSLKDEAELRALVEAILGDYAARAVEVSELEVLAYAGARMQEGDPEWDAACSQGRKGEKVSAARTPAGGPRVGAADWWGDCDERARGEIRPAGPPAPARPRAA